MSKTSTPARPVRVTPHSTVARPTSGRQQPLARKKRDEAPTRKFEMPFEARNIQIILLGVLIVGIGYLVMYMSPTMSFTALTVSPIILVLGYMVVIPYGILYGVKKHKTTLASSEPSANGTAS